MPTIAINGFGRIGRLVLRAILKKYPDMNVIATNDITDAKTLAYLFKYDSIHKIYQADIKHTENSIIINGKEIKIFAEKDPEALPWKY